MQRMPEKGLGDTLEVIGWVMAVLALVMGAIAVFSMGQVTTIERAYYGVREVTQWSPAVVAIILISTAWTVMLSFAVTKIGVVLQWLEISHIRDDLEKQKAEQLKSAAR